MTDRKIGIDGNNDGIADFYRGDIASIQDYYSFGMLEPGRSFITSSSSYNFGFNNKLKDDEISGSANHLDFGERGYDPRRGQWWSTDPKFQKYPFFSPYVAFGCNPIFFIDMKGDTIGVAGDLTSAETKLKISKFQELVYDAFAGKVVAAVNPLTGIVTYELTEFDKNDNPTVLNQYEQAAFNSLVHVQNSPLVVKVNLVDHNTPIEQHQTADGVWNTDLAATSSIDLDDIAVYDRVDKGRNLFQTSKGKLVHFFVEQLEMKEREANPATNLKKYHQEVSRPSHRAALYAENRTTSFQRSTTGVNMGSIGTDVSGNTYDIPQTEIKDANGRLINIDYAKGQKPK